MTDYRDEKFYCEDDDVLYFVFHKDEPWLGVTILSSKALKKRKSRLYLLKNLKINNIFLKKFGGFKIKQ